MSTSDTNPGDAVSVTFLSPPRDWAEGWQAFQQAHADWRLATESAPVYCLPLPAVERLALARATALPLLTADDACAERAFTELCRLHPAVGCWQGWPVAYGPLQSPPELPKSLLQQQGWAPQQQLAARQLAAGSQERTQRLKGYAGWLLTEPAFVQQTQGLAGCWQTLPADERPRFPLGRSLTLPGWDAALSPSPAAAFGLEVRGFLDRWGLTELATWDLPTPQGPLLPNPLPPGSPAVPAHGVHLVLPLHYPLQGGDDLLLQIFDFQRQAVRDLGLDESLAGLPHHKGYASLFDVLHLERAIRARLHSGRTARGVVTPLEEAIAAGLGISLAQVQKCRKAISACLRGRRSRVTWLRPRLR
jgi:hypothetical protein